MSLSLCFLLLTKSSSQHSSISNSPNSKQAENHQHIELIICDTRRKETKKDKRKETKIFGIKLFSYGMFIYAQNTDSEKAQSLKLSAQRHICDLEVKDMEDGVSGFCIRAGSFRRGDGNGNSGSSGTKCGRWNPTTEQVKLLTDLFMSGLRTPSTDQIQKISTELSCYGKIESKNVFYWFQNHKARERQKRRKVSFHDKDLSNIRRQNSLPSSTHNFAEVDAVQEPERVIETLQLFPLNSLGESEAEKLRAQSSKYGDDSTMFRSSMGERADNPSLDLRLSSL